jgi:hypothetical protein
MVIKEEKFEREARRFFRTIAKDLTVIFNKFGFGLDLFSKKIENYQEKTSYPIGIFSIFGIFLFAYGVIYLLESQALFASLEFSFFFFGIFLVGAFVYFK